mmetsp:Transcript_41651/g.114917  ORF Transcript_41651/g.114917 Transcript_41651/m.114917 type:complete len:326 (-) Transcript_41651:170-1147(-)
MRAVIKRPVASKSAAKLLRKRPTEIVNVNGLKGLSKRQASRWEKVRMVVRKSVPGDRSKEHGDRYVLKKIFCQRPYTRLLEKVRKQLGVAAQSTFFGKRVADLGASIGGFTILAMESGAAEICSFEMDPETFALLQKNTSRNRKVLKFLPQSGKKLVLKQAAIVADASKKVYLYSKLSPGTVEGTLRYSPDRPNRNSVISDRVNNSTAGPEVETWSMKTFLQKYRPQLLKMDVEGCEAEIVRSGCDFAGVEVALIYYHLDKFPKLRDLLAFLKSLRKVFSKVEHEKTPALPGDWQEQLKTQPDLERTRVDGPAAAKMDVLVCCMR